MQAGQHIKSKVLAWKNRPWYEHCLSILSKIIRQIGSSSTTRTRRPAGNSSTAGLSILPKPSDTRVVVLLLWCKLVVIIPCVDVALCELLVALPHCCCWCCWCCCCPPDITTSGCCCWRLAMADPRSPTPTLDLLNSSPTMVVHTAIGEWCMIRNLSCSPWGTGVCGGLGMMMMTMMALMRSTACGGLHGPPDYYY